MNKIWISTLFCALVTLAAGGQAQPLLELRDAWVRALPPSQPTTAAYLVLRNSGDVAQTVTGASVPVAGRVEIHTMREIDGYLRMQQLPRLELPAGAEVALEPGATHLMLLELERMPVQGEVLDLCLDLASGEQVCTRAEVRRDDAPQAPHQHHHH